MGTNWFSTASNLCLGCHKQKFLAKEKKNRNFETRQGKKQKLLEEESDGKSSKK
jgi:homoaconitase/3-isopropylmalate dehydratase large subunit